MSRKVKLLILSFLTLIPFLLLHAAPSAWQTIPTLLTPDSDARIESGSLAAFRLTLTPGAQNNAKCGTQLVYTMDAPVKNPKQIAFRACCPDGGTISAKFVVSARENGKSVPHWGPEIKISGKEWKNYVLRLDKDLGMPDKEYHIWQIKPGVGIVNPRGGQAVTMAVEDFRFEDAPALPAAAARPQRKNADWSYIPETLSKDSRAEMESFSPTEFTLTLIPGPQNNSNCAVQVVRSVDAPVHAQGKLVFRARCSEGGSVQVHLILSTRQNGKVVMHWGPKITISGREFARYHFGLDSTFGLLDQEYLIRQIKPFIGINGTQAGKKVTVEFRDFQIGSAESLGLGSDQAEVIVYPPAHPRQAPAPDALKVYFHLDNDDDVAVSAKGLTDPIPYRGYREMLLDTVKDAATLCDSPEEADVIVYSAAARDPKAAARIAAAVRKGTGLYAAANIADPEVAELIPAEVTVREVSGFPERSALKPTGKNAALFRELSDAKFGIYRDLRPRPGTEILLTGDNGAPLLVRRGKVIYNAFGLGCGLIREKAAIDPFLLRVLSELTGRKLAEKELSSPRRNGDGWQEGITAENIGRVGFALGDGLLCETIRNNLSVASGSGEYEFLEKAAPKLRLNKWHIRSISGAPAEQERDVDWNYSYGQIGVLELSCAPVIPEKWRGKPLFFQVERGIDDLAEVYFNDTLLGKVTRDMPNYWERPHRYRIPEDKIRFGAENKIRVVTENLRESGGFGSCPEILPPQPPRAARHVYVDRANPFGKGGKVVDTATGETHRFDTSLAFPGIRWEFPGENTFLALSNLAAYAAVFRNGGLSVFDLRTPPRLTGKWDKPVLLLFPKDQGIPLLLVFSKQPDSVSFDFSGGELSGLTVTRRGGIGMILPLWIEGNRRVSTIGWEKKLPEEFLRKIDFWIPKAYAYPIAAREYFKIDREKGRIQIRTTYSYRKTANDWKIKPEPFAPVSPLAYFTRGMLFESPEAENWQLPTAFGYFAAKSGSDTVNWSLPLPKDELPAYPGCRIGGDVDTVINEVYAKAARFIGGSRPVATANFIHPFKPSHPGRNMSLHMWLHGTPGTVVAPFGLNPRNLENFKARLAYRLLTPVEQYGYKSASRWREEPYSGLRYPVCFNSPRVHHTKFAPGTGSNFNICDANESVYMITTVACAVAEQFGQREFIRANPTWFRWFTKLIFSGDDPVTLTGHCGESGQAASIDMLNCEYAGMMNVARIAEILGDDAWRDQALYRAARRMVPTLARFSFKNYIRETGLALFKVEDVYGTGFTESGYEYRFGVVPRNTSYHLYDMSQGIPPRLLKLYADYIPKGQEEYLRRFIRPSLYDGNGVFRQDHAVMNMAVRLGGLSAEERLKFVKDCLANGKLLQRLSGDYPGIRLTSNVTMALDFIYGDVRATDCRDLDIRSFHYDPQRKMISAEIAAGKEPKLVLRSDFPPVEPAYPAMEDGNFEIPLKSNQLNTVQIRLK